MLQVQMPPASIQSKCEYWLNRQYVLNRELAQPMFTLGFIEHMINYELVTRKRLPVLKRLLGRKYRLKRDDDWRKMKEFLGVRESN